MRRAVIGILCVCTVCISLLCSCRISPLMEAEYENENEHGQNQVIVLKAEESDSDEDRDINIQDDSVREIIVEVPAEPEEETVSVEKTEDEEKPSVPEETVVSEEPEQEESVEIQEHEDQVIVQETVPETVSEKQPSEEPVQYAETVQQAAETPQEVVESPHIEQTVYQEPVYTYSEFTALKRVVCALNVRSGPSVGYDLIDTLAGNEIVTVTGQCNETGWYRIERNGYTGYCSPDYLADIVEEPVGEYREPAQNTESAQQMLNENSGNNSETQQQSQQTQQAAEPVRLSCDYVTTEGAVSTAIYNNAVNTYNDLPSWVKAMFQREGWIICVSSLDYAGRYGFSGIGGLTVYNDKTIFVCDDEGCTSRDCIWHEMGHFVDYEIGREIGGRPSNTDEWSDIMKAEGQTMKECFNWYITSITEHEYYAEATYFYWDRPSELQKVAPCTYAYLNNIYAGR